MARLKEVYGPYGHALDRWVAVWMFSGVRDDGEFAAWKLTYYFAERKFKAAAVKTSAEAKYAKAMSQGRLFNEGEDVTAPLLEGRVVDILKDRIPAEQLAAAIARSIIGG